MPYFVTGLEGLLEKIALNIGPATAPRPEGMHRDYAAAAASHNAAVRPAPRGASGTAAPRQIAPLREERRYKDPATAQAYIQAKIHGPQVTSGPSVQLAPGMPTMEQHQQAQNAARDASHAAHGITPEMIAAAGGHPGAANPAGAYVGLTGASAHETAAPMHRQDTPPNVLQRFGQGARGVGRNLGRGLGYGTAAALGLGTLGAGWALSKQHEEDDKQRGVAYAPMSGTPGTSFMG